MGAAWAEMWSGTQPTLIGMFALAVCSLSQSEQEEGEVAAEEGGYNSLQTELDGRHDAKQQQVQGDVEEGVTDVTRLGVQSP